MAARRMMLPDYGTVSMKGTQYYRTRVTDQQRWRVSLYARTREELYQKEQEAIQQIENKTYRRSTPTVEEYCEKWLLMQSAQIRMTTLIDYTSKVKNYIIKPLGDMHMGDVTADDIRLALLVASKKSASVYKSVNVIYKCIFTAAMESKIIDDKKMEELAESITQYILRYVTESTFDSYMWQLIENKQKFISQIMTSKAPVRSCEDVDEAALSYAEVKALATGNPAVKEKMALDVDVAKLKLLKANHMNNQYRLEDDIARNFPQQIAKLTEIIASYKADIAHFSEHKITDPEQFSMEISGKVFTEKKEAGAALLAVCKDIKSVDAAMDIGSYQGFNMRIQFDSWSKEFILSVKHESVAKVRLGADALGNITRINNLLESYPEKLAEAEQRLETVQEQMTNAKEEVGKPFPKEEELNQKLERLSELNALLNMDEREVTETEQSESKEKEERPARGSIHEKLQIYKEKSQRESETGKETRKRDFGLE